MVWRCKQAGLVDKWVEDLNLLYASQGEVMETETSSTDDDNVRNGKEGILCCNRDSVET